MVRLSWRNRIAVGAGGALLASALVAGYYVNAAPRKLHADVGSIDARVARGKYLVSITGCHDCHTPWKMGPRGPEPDMSRMLSGHPAELEMPPLPLTSLGDGPWAWVGARTNTAYTGPWGVSYAANLTPDELTGIGIWTEDIFINTIRRGRHWGVSRPLLPPMPWPVYANMTDEDLKSVFAFLRTIPPIHNQVPDAEPADEGNP